MTLDAYQNVRFFEGIARDAAGNPLVSPELVVQPFFMRANGGRENVLVRGVEPIALAVHDEVKIVEGRMFQPSTGEVIIGRNVEGRYLGAELGRALEFGRNTWQVVGIFESGGTSLESEVWSDVRQLASDAKRTVPYSGLRVRVADGADMDALARRIGDDPRYALEATPERDTTRSRRSRRTCSTTSWWRWPCSPAPAPPSAPPIPCTRRAGAHRRDRHAACARLLPRHDPRSFLIESLVVRCSGSRWEAPAPGRSGT